jgi:Domain of unknown function (DUF4032)
VDEIELEPGARAGRLRLRVAVTNRRFHARELERRTGIVALGGQARLLMNDLREYRAWLAWYEGRPIDRPTAAERWLRDVYRPTALRLTPAIGPARDVVQAYCDVLAHKWFLSEQAGRDIGFERAIVSYLEMGAPAPEVAPEAGPEAAIVDPAEDSGLDPA